MIGVFGREELLSGAVEVDAVEVPEVGIAAGLLAYAEEVESAGFLVDAKDLRDIAVSVGDLAFELAGGEVVEIEIAPVVALAEPEDLIGFGQIVPVDFAVAAFVELGGGFAHDFADFAGGGVGYAEPLLLVVAGSGDEGEMGVVGREFDVVPGGAAAGYVVAERGAVLVGRHLQTHDGVCRHVDDDALDHGDVFVADERVFPCFERGMAVGDGNQIHLAGLALVLLKRRDLFRVGGPEDDGGFGLLPACVVGSIAEVLDAAGGELSFRA